MTQPRIPIDIVDATPNERLSRALAQLVGADPVFVALKQKLPLLARYGAPVLLTGETGTGKELCADAPLFERESGKSLSAGELWRDSSRAV